MNEGRGPRARAERAAALEPARNPRGGGRLYPADRGFP